MKRKNEKGFTLVELMIAAGLAAGLSLVVSKIMQNAYKNEKSIEVKQNLTEVFSRVSTYIRNKAVCSRVFQIAPGGEIEQFKIDDDPFSTTGIVLEKDKEIGNTKVIVQKMELLNDPLAIAANDGIYDLTFRITLKRKEGNYYMAGTTKIKDFILSARLCEKSAPHPFLVGLGLNFKIQACNDSCAADSDCTHHYSVPMTDAEVAPASHGIHYCYLCGPTYIVQSCI
jgi:prepilin-type N-terminal cleavage/methylation domain-containing protein